MRIALIYVGSTNERHYACACAGYEKRLCAFADFKSLCVKDERVSDEGSPAAVKKALAEEERRIRRALPKTAFTAALTPEGESLSSEELASRLAALPEKGVSSIAFVIGGSHGIAETLKADCDALISMSQMTFPHMLARVMFTEQLYRAYTIINGKKYHK